MGKWLVALLLSGMLASAAQASWIPLRGDLAIHDPSTIIKCKDRYYIFGTGRGIISKSSADKVFWKAGPTVFSTSPAWTSAIPNFDGTIWAPDIIYLNGRYCLYYAVSSWGSQVSAIGLVTNPTLDPTDPAYHWTDQGIVIQSSNGSPYNTIDPSITLDANGNPWMSFGSYWTGIYVVQLDPNTGLRIAPDSPTYRVAYHSSIEASCIYRHGNYYYLFVDWGSCCSGVNSTYHVLVGRSTSITGPYLDRSGTDMVNNGGTLFLEGTGKFTGPGHVAILNEDGRQWFSYHYYDAGAYAPWYNAYGVSDFDIEPLSWTDDGWPVFTNDWSAVYTFDADARDANGQYYGLLQNGASIQNDTTRGHVLNLNGTNQIVRLPAGVAFARTFEAVVKWNGGAPWQRIFDFGVDTSRYLMLTPYSGDGKLRFDIKAGGGVQTLQGPYQLPPHSWVQVAVTLDGSRGILYFNGAPVATNNTMTISPLDVLAQTNYLGRSKFAADPDFNGQISSFRVYGRALSTAEIQAPHPLITEPADKSFYSPGETISFAGSARDLIDLPLGTNALTWRIESVLDGVTNILLGSFTGVTAGTFTVPADATNGEIFRVVLAARDNGGRIGTVASTLFSGDAPSQWASEYPFDANASDADGNFNGTLQGGASIVADPDRGHVLNLSGPGQYVSLPTAVHNMQTFGAWVKWNGGAPWQRIFDFGSGTARWVMLTPKDGAGTMQCAISSDTASFTQVMEAPEALPIGKWTYVAVAFDGREGILYVNGQAVAVNNSVNLLPSDVVTTQAWLGKSQYTADAYFNGRLDSVSLNSTAPTPTEIISSFLHPDLGMTIAGPSTIFSWPEWAGLVNLYTTTNLIPPFQWNRVAAPAALSNGVYSVSVPSKSGDQFYRLQWP